MPKLSRARHGPPVLEESPGIVCMTVAGLSVRWVRPGFSKDPGPSTQKRENGGIGGFVNRIEADYNWAVSVLLA